MKPAEKSNKKTLDARESVFAELVADPTDNRSIGDKGVAAGWTDPKHGYRVAQRKHVADRVDELVEADMRIMRARRARVLGAVERRSRDDSRSDCTENSRLYFQVSGDISTGGATQVVRVDQHVTGREDETLEDRMQDSRRVKSDRLVSKN